ncbi:MAG TPA: glycosyltransferase family 4 protein [Pyrinomonadaceae bacterium]|jgi:glycosyltransferase involved in cell wall biosynthesis
MEEKIQEMSIRGEAHRGELAAWGGADGVRPVAAAATTKGKPLRILIVGPSLDPPGGQAVQAAHLLEHLPQDASLEVSFLPINPRLPGPWGKVQAVKYVRTVVTMILYCASLATRLRKYDVIHIFSASYLSFVLAPTPALLVARLYGKRSVLNYHSGQAEDHLERWRRSATATIRLADRLVVPSAYLVEVFARFGLRARAIHNFVATERFHFRERGSSPRPHFFSNRSFEPLYNVACTLRAFALIQQRFPEASLTLAGDGSQRAELERLAAELDLRHVTFTGCVLPERMPGLYDEADIFLNSSEIDNMPVSIIEAFAAGLPVVTTDAGGIPFIVADGQTGLITKRGDYEALAACAIRLLEDDELRSTLTRNAREECRKYSWSAVRDQWLGLYGEVAGGLSLAKERSLEESATASEH